MYQGGFLQDVVLGQSAEGFEWQNLYRSARKGGFLSLELFFFSGPLPWNSDFFCRE
jgi:hypothetical protein